eukprot:4621628-Amphidinium_carterae.1
MLRHPMVQSGLICHTARPLSVTSASSVSSKKQHVACSFEVQPGPPAVTWTLWKQGDECNLSTVSTDELASEVSTCAKRNALNALNDCKRSSRQRKNKQPSQSKTTFIHTGVATRSAN